MEQYIVSARKYRPATFSSVVGQDALTSTLKNAIATGRLAHAYLFCGSRGVGKTSCARIFAKTINCTNRTPDGEACNECDSCRAFNSGASMNIVELDAASNNGVDDMRQLIDQVQVPPTQAKYRVFIIDEVHMLSAAAFNAFLKTLEEPPRFVVFILATTEKHKIIPTILSRCQIYDFNRITVSDMVSHLGRVAAAEGITAEPAALNVIARQADGAMRDALSIFDQVAASSRGNITYQSTIENLNVLDSAYYVRLVDAFTAQDIPAALTVFHEIRRKGFDSHFFINGLGAHLRDLMMASNPATLQLLDLPDDVRQTLAQQASKLKPEFLYDAMGICNETDLNYRTSSNKQLLVELALIRIAQLLNPSPRKSGQGEGSLKPIQPAPAKATAAPAPSSAAPTGIAQTSSPSPASPMAQEPAQTYRPAQPQHPVTNAADPGAVPPPRRKEATVLRVGVTGNDTGRPQRPAPASAATMTRTPAELTVEMVRQAWTEFANSLPAAQNVLKSELLKLTPEKVNDRWTVVSDNTVVATMLTQSADLIAAGVRQRLSCPDFNYELEIHEGELPPRYWSQQRVLEHLLEKDSFRDFYNKMKLSLI
ncbi:MAG: DNA polymerase III subunit gamma/tau [Muribaculaceae bacterium]|nr:DNA polymerase III subunit gamma/tau [Muribaculaceae bacterium]